MNNTIDALAGPKMPIMMYELNDDNVFFSRKCYFISTLIYHFICKKYLNQSKYFKFLIKIYSTILLDYIYRNLSVTSRMQCLVAPPNIGVVFHDIAIIAVRSRTLKY